MMMTSSMFLVLIFSFFRYENAAKFPGSSTCCIVAIDGNNLNSANLGDSGFMVIRGNAILHHTNNSDDV